MEHLSLLCPGDINPQYVQLMAESSHDLAVGIISGYLTENKSEQNLIKKIMTAITDNAQVIKYRSDVFEDILSYPELRNKLRELLQKIDFLKNYSGIERDTGTTSIWELIHRMTEIGEYIICIESMYDCLNNFKIKSEGLLTLKKYVSDTYENTGFKYLKKDIEELKSETAHVKSVTLGVNLNEKFEPNGVGIVSVNSKYYTKSGILSSFHGYLSQKDDLNDIIDKKMPLTFKTIQTTKTPQNFKSVQIERLTIPNVNQDGSANNIMTTLDSVVESMLSATAKKLKSILVKHFNVSSFVLSALLSELTYYILWAEFAEKLRSNGLPVCKPKLIENKARELYTKGVYNLKLSEKVFEDSSFKVVCNDIEFNSEHRIYILTGANRGGKTTITQAVGIAFLLAQNGLCVPAEEFAFSPVDNIFTHFPADEENTMDLGRLGEEAKRFKEIYSTSTDKSLILLNESFSTTSFEEGYFIARDAVKALKVLGPRVIYNTHMHKLAADKDDLNKEIVNENNVESLVMESEEGLRSFKLIIAPPSGNSYAMDIAKKYGVTYDQLCNGTV